MTATGPAVALLFDDTELGGQLREALHERGARIVHEGGVASLSRELLDRYGVEVLVVNLDDTADDALDQLYEVIDGDRPRVVFNDAQASRALAGWDRARWARHLAVKVLAAGDIDPPRPAHARDIEMSPPPAPVAAVTATDQQRPESDAASEPAAAEPETAASAFDESVASAMADLPAASDLDELHSDMASVESENLAAELEALLAAGDLPIEEESASGSGLRFADGEELPPLLDGHFGMPLDALGGEPAGGLDEVLAAAVGAMSQPPAALTAPVFHLDHLQLSPLDAEVAAAAPAAAALANASVTAPVRAPDNWALLDDTSPAAVETPDAPDAAAFGIHKLSAAEFLAPDVAAVDPAIEPLMSLQLISLEEAIAPQAYEHVHEMVLDDTGSALSRLVLLGAAASGAASVAAFLAALPATSRLTLVLLQHLAGQSAQELAQQLAGLGTLPVRVATPGARARAGEVLVVPSGQQARVHRDGRVELQAAAADAAPGPSIDASFSIAANVFGRDALAIVFAGQATDAVAGAQAIHDRGGQVWVESSSGEHSADMVSGIFAERLVSFSGAPHELAAHLVEVFP